MKVLNGAELAGFIKERQARQVRALRQTQHIAPRLAIIQTLDDQVINKYVSLKKQYGADILVEVDSYFVPVDKAAELISQLNEDKNIHGIILQLPLTDASRTDELVNAVAPQKDVDGLGKHAVLDPATPLSILWLLAGYNIELRGKNIVIVGQGRLVGAPLANMLRASGLSVTVADKSTDNLSMVVREADILITGTGVPHLITSDMIKVGAVVVDAGVATDSGKLVGDLADDVRERDDLTITPAKGGVGPLTVCALFDNVIRAAQQAA